MFVNTCIYVFNTYVDSCESLSIVTSILFIAVSLTLVSQ